jgi:hypothetical protein
LRRINKLVGDVKKKKLEVSRRSGEELEHRAKEVAASNGEVIEGMKHC